MAAALSLLQSQVETRRMIGLLKQKLDSLLIKNLFLNVKHFFHHPGSRLTINKIHDLNIIMELTCPTMESRAGTTGFPPEAVITGGCSLALKLSLLEWNASSSP
ncbi:hypothetical protein [Paracidovorax oryzae]|uniref:hypothetical protein n=1 Tax=Paracidovorax oryzae TaxID=862720 RepID=UPI0012EB8F0B|nr:hypothetical protein [Paracidovorax oryzae]